MGKMGHGPTRELADLTQITDGFNSPTHMGKNINRQKKMILSSCELQVKRVDPWILASICLVLG
jgi:hypothetical protein